jgi:adenylate cyclase
MKEQVFVERERELAQLNEFLDTALAGQSQVCFVTGEAGSGKTTLITEFARRAEEANANLVIAIGTCDAHTGIGDPYLPFREILGLLTGDVEAKLAQGAITQENANRLGGLLRWSGKALLRLGPDLIGIMIPGAVLMAKAGAFAVDQVGWLDKLEKLIERKRLRGAQDRAPGVSNLDLEQSHIFEQYTNVLRALAVERPLMLVVDDLQWADTASTSLLFHLGRRVGESRILIVGTYRPDELAMGRAGERHPLEKVLTEFKRYFGDIWVDLDVADKAEARHFVDALLDTEPNRLGEDFRQALFRHTGGHPLFTIELLRDMQERGDLAQDEEGRWVEDRALEWDMLPARVEGVIEERIGRLEEELREVLTVASVEGEDFTAQVIARVQEMSERHLVHRLTQELDRQYRLVQERGIKRIGEQRLSLYCFRHHLFQSYLYNNLGQAEREFLHEDVGKVLEELYGDQVDEIAAIAPQLARHFEGAGLEEKARHYLYQAGERARRQYAHEEAVAYLSRALELTPETDYSERYAILSAREGAYDVQGEREAQQGDLAALGQLAEALDSDERRAEVAVRLAYYAYVTSDYPAAIAVAQQATVLAQTAGVVESEASGYLWRGVALYRQGHYPEASVQLEEALRLAQAAGLRRAESDSLRALGALAFAQGDRARARGYWEQALALCREIGDRRGEGNALNNLGIVTRQQGNYTGAQGYYEQALALFREIGDRRGEAFMVNSLGTIAGQQRNYARARDYFEQALALGHEIGDRRGEAFPLANLGEVCLLTGDYAGARGYLEQALTLFREIGDRRFDSHILAYLGLLCHRLGDDEAARQHSQQALGIAREVGARHEESYALTFLGHALVELGRLEEAAAAYRDAQDLWRELGHLGPAMDSLAGLARVSLAQGDQSQAQAQVEEILSYLETNSLEGADEPFRVYLTCYRVLKANQHPRAQEILTTAYNLLQEQAGNTTDEKMRRSFLENVPAHQELVREWAGGA